jgi:hypothetical protein
MNFHFYCPNDTTCIEVVSHCKTKAAAIKYGKTRYSSPVDVLDENEVRARYLASPAGQAATHLSHGNP